MSAEDWMDREDTEPVLEPKRLKVFVDGREIKDVVKVSAKEGMVVVLARDADGRFKIDSSGKRIARDIIFGQVHLEVMEDK